ncbi:MAG: AraC family transcriptional regulator ligand-binding domain-containing protein [Halioglobus sp.]
MEISSIRFSPDDRVMSILYVSMLKTTLESEGYTLLGFDGSDHDLSDYHRKISTSDFLAILEQSLKPTVASGLGFRYAELFDMAAAGTVGQLLMSCRNIEQAFENILHYFPLLSLSFQLDAGWDGDSYRVELDRHGTPEMSDPAKWFVIESLFYCLLKQGRYLTGKPLTFQHASVSYERPPHWEMYQAMLGCEVEFGASAPSITVDRDYMASTIVTSNQPVLAMKERQCRKLLQRCQSQYSIAERIHATLKRTLPNLPSLECMASELNMSRSTLYRRLQDDDYCYQTIVAEFRRDEAVNHLKNTDLTICEIAEKLGFSDDSNFRRAFKKWTGTSPSEVREDIPLASGVSGPNR